MSSEPTRSARNKKTVSYVFDRSENYQGTPIIERARNGDMMVVLEYAIIRVVVYECADGKRSILKWPFCYAATRNVGDMIVGAMNAAVPDDERPS